MLVSYLNTVASDIDASRKWLLLAVNLGKLHIGKNITVKFPLWYTGIAKAHLRILTP